MKLSDWISEWIIDKNSQIRGRLGCHVLTEVQAAAWQPRFFCSPCGCLSGILHTQGTKPLLDEIDTVSGWQIARTSGVVPAPTKRLRCTHLHHHQYRLRYHPDTRWQRCQASWQGSCWCISESSLVRLSDLKTLLGTQSGCIGSWTQFSTHPLCGFSFDSRYWWGQVM